jgi:hypothetical protein
MIARGGGNNAEVRGGARRDYGGIEEGEMAKCKLLLYVDNIVLFVVPLRGLEELENPRIGGAEGARGKETIKHIDS